MKHSIFYMAGLQLFADGGEGAAAQDTGVMAGDTARQSAGVNTEQPSSPSDDGVEANPETEFEQLIKGKYKQQYDSRVRDTLRQRLKGKDSQITDLTSRQQAVQPILELLGRRYGVDTADLAALGRAMESDDSFLEADARALGLNVEQYRKFRDMEQENARLRQADQDRRNREQADQLYARWHAQAAQAREVYPGLDLKEELQNPRFLELLRGNVDIRTAYEVIHKDEIIPAAMHAAARNVEARLARKIAAGGARPVENGVAGGSAALVRSDVSRLSRSDIDEVMRRVARGERVTFG